MRKPAINGISTASSIRARAARCAAWTVSARARAAGWTIGVFGRGIRGITQPNTCPLSRFHCATVCAITLPERVSFQPVDAAADPAAAPAAVEFAPRGRSEERLLPHLLPLGGPLRLLPAHPDAVLEPLRIRLQ